MFCSRAEPPASTGDDFELAITAASSEAVAALGRSVRSCLLHRADAPQHLESALRSDPELMLGHVLQGFCWRLLARRDLTPRIASAIDRAERSAQERGATLRERLLLAALTSWHQGDVASSLESLRAALESHPECLLSMKLHHAVSFMYGKLELTRRVLERSLGVLEQRSRRASGGTTSYGLMLGCHAFVLEESGCLVEAEQAAHRALEITPGDVWAFHALIHVHTVRERTDQGLNLLRGRGRQFEGGNNFLAHLSWHQALLAIAERNYEEALVLYDRQLAPALGLDYRDLANCVSLLVRLERVGVEVGARYEALADLAEAQLGDHSLAFADAHYVLALLGAGRVERAQSFVRSLLDSRAKGAAHQRSEDDAEVYSRAGVPLVLGLCALRSGTPQHAVREFASLGVANLQRLGGSHVQRDLFLQLSRDASKWAPAPAGRARRTA